MSLDVDRLWAEGASGAQSGGGVSPYKAGGRA